MQASFLRSCRTVEAGRIPGAGRINSRLPRAPSPPARTAPTLRLSVFPPVTKGKDEGNGCSSVFPCVLCGENTGTCEGETRANQSAQDDFALLAGANLFALHPVFARPL